MNAFRQKCIELRGEGHTLSEIVQITGRGKTSVYYHIRAIPLSKTRWKIIKRAQGAHIRKFALARKGKSKRMFTKFDVWNPGTVLLVAHLLFDGEFTGGKGEYNNRSRTLLARVEREMKRLYEFPPKRYINTHTGVSRIGYFNVALADFLQKRAKALLKEVNTLPQEMKRAFLRGFLDDEGCIYFHEKKKRTVRGYQKDTSILRTVQRLLADFRIQSRILLPNEIAISGRDNLIAFQKEINFSGGVRINGNRSNSLWKQSLEKREILRRAIASFPDYNGKSNANAPGPVTKSERDITAARSAVDS